MKKYMVLLSVLVLAACGGGAGGGAGIGAPNGTVRTGVNNRVDSNSGLSMIDINKARVARLQRAEQVASAIESGLGIDSSASVNRAASIQRNSGASGTNGGGITYTAADIDAAYDSMNEIFSGDVEGKTVHEILVALALGDLDRNEILDLLGYDENGDDELNDKILDLADVFSAEQKPEEILRIINNANSIYKDFGREFTLTLENARFGTSSSGGRDFTFIFNNDNKVSAIHELWEGGRQYDAVGGGKFEARIIGTEYSVAVPTVVLDEHGDPVLDENQQPVITYVDHIVVNDQGNSIPVDELLYPTGQEPSGEGAAAQIRTALLGNALSHFDENATTERANLTAWFADAPIIALGQTCTRPAGCIVYAHADYLDSITVESKGAALGLKYSDFGLKLDKTVTSANDERYPGITYKEHTVFAGGYPEKRVTPNQAMSFTGVAYAGVTRKSNEWTSLADYHEPDVKYYNGTANLTIAEDNNHVLKENLVADFSGEGWYTVTVSDMNLGGNGGGNGGNIAFSGTPTDSRFVVDITKGNVEQSYTRYYGPDVNTPTEAVGAVQYVERKPNETDETNWTFKADISFGAKKNN